MPETAPNPAPSPGGARRRPPMTSSRCSRALTSITGKGPGTGVTVQGSGARVRVRARISFRVKAKVRFRRL